MADILNLLDLIANEIFDKKGINILALDVREVSSITNYVVIAEGMVDRHVIALAEGIMHALEEKKAEKPLNVEGLENGDWVVLDYGAYMIHLFTPGFRERYRLEELYRSGHILNLNIKV